MVVIPSSLREIADSEGEAEFRGWVSSLPEIVTELSRRWGLRVGEPYEPGGQCSWVAPALNSSGEELALKIGWRHPEAEHEADALRMWNGNGAVVVHASETLDRTSALLLERCTPGTALARTLPEPEQDVVVAGLLRRLWVQPVDHRFETLQVMCEAWAVEFERRTAERNVDVRALNIDRGLARTAMELFRELPRSTECAVLLATDLHAGNVLSARREPWLAIDPKPYVGDPTYDALQHILGCEERLARDSAGFAQRMADLLDLDADRVRLWLFARCVQWSPDRAELYPVAVRLAP